MKLLIVDTSIAIIQRLREMISEYIDKEIIDHSINYSEASTKIKINSPDIVLLDLALPANKSFLLLKEIKKKKSKITVIVLSDTSDMRLKEKCDALGADYFFDKYHDYEALPALIDMILAGKN